MPRLPFVISQLRRNVLARQEARDKLKASELMRDR
jgi:hypothetical protein